MTSGILKLYDGSSSFTNVDLTEIPENFTTSGSTLLIEWNSASNLTRLGLYAKITTIDIADFENVTLGEDDFCSSLKPCNQDEGDCDFDSHCNGTDLRCIHDSCPAELGFLPGADCCRDPCYGLIDMESGLLIAPNHPFNYIDNVKCSGQISVQKGYLIKVEFGFFRVIKQFPS